IEAKAETEQRHDEGGAHDVPAVEIWSGHAWTLAAGRGRVSPFSDAIVTLVLPPTLLAQGAPLGLRALQADAELLGEEPHVRLSQHQSGVGGGAAVDLETDGGEVAPAQATVLSTAHVSRLGAEKHDGPGEGARLVAPKGKQIGLGHHLQIELRAIAAQEVA